ncbi:uncharacterized protein LOC114008989 [Tupaia chinensis]|uniref:uncharacterized protein LOC114008989 n=1 Tax=Tupaia chinensis TaxID=246437 RepID=UPI000FFBF3D0|nr:uncharacterized protein LOC114008989 [Tupaia chinensis]
MPDESLGDPPTLWDVLMKANYCQGTVRMVPLLDLVLDSGLSRLLVGVLRILCGGTRLATREAPPEVKGDVPDNQEINKRRPHWTPFGLAFGKDPIRTGVAAAPQAQVAALPQPEVELPPQPQQSPHSTLGPSAPPALAQGPAAGLRSRRAREEEEPSSSEWAPILPIRALGGTSPEGECTSQYWPFSSSDLYNWKTQNPPFSEDPRGLTGLFESILYTHSPTWGDCQQLLKTLFTTEERERILTEAQKNVPGGDGRPTTLPNLIDEGFPLTRPNWDFGNAEGRWMSNAQMTHYQGLLLDTPRVTFSEPTSLNLATLLPNPELDKPVHNCQEILAEIFHVRPDLQDSALPNSKVIWYTDGSSLCRTEY